MTFTKPPKLQAGDTVAAISLSSGAAGELRGLRGGEKNLRQTLGVHLTENPSALKPDDWLYRNPEARADDLHCALQNPDIKGIFGRLAIGRLRLRDAKLQTLTIDELRVHSVKVENLEVTDTLTLPS